MSISSSARLKSTPACEARAPAAEGERTHDLFRWIHEGSFRSTRAGVASCPICGVPNNDLGAEVKAVVQLMPDIAAGPEIVEELMAFCAAHLACQKCPRSIDFETDGQAL
jgi:hypothetical protein